ncbi:unnamed protein product [Brassica rapa subsp. trilocularis]
MTLYAFIIGYFVGRVSSAWLQACVMAYFVAYAANPEGANFDNTIPERIARQNVEENKSLADNEVRQTEEEQEITYIIYPLSIETYHFCLLFDFLKLFQPYRLCRLDIV